MNIWAPALEQTWWEWTEDYLDPFLPFCLPCVHVGRHWCAWERTWIFKGFYLLPSFCSSVPLSAAFICVVGSEFVQKYLAEGPCMVRDVFQLARENAPSIIFIDEIDAIATKRFDAQTGGMSSCTHNWCSLQSCNIFHIIIFPLIADREVQRILLELLNQMDGFHQSVNMKVCTSLAIVY